MPVEERGRLFSYNQNEIQTVRIIQQTKYHQSPMWGQRLCTDVPTGDLQPQTATVGIQEKNSTQNSELN